MRYEEIENSRVFMEISAPPWPGHTGRCLWCPEGDSWVTMMALKKGDYCLHYRTSKAKEYRTSFVGISKIKSSYSDDESILTREELIGKLKNLGIYNYAYEIFANTWLKDHERFYFIELTDFELFQRAVTLQEIQSYKPEFKVPQQYIKRINDKEELKLILTLAERK